MRPAKLKTPTIKVLIYFKLMEYWEASEIPNKSRKANAPMCSLLMLPFMKVSLNTLYKTTQARKRLLSGYWTIRKILQLDKKADEYLEQIAQAMQMQRLLAKKWNISATAGLNYDSNILFLTRQ